MDNTDRDRSIDALLRRGEGFASHSTDQCVDAESLAAWMDGGLSGDARAAVEQHAAGCARCQALLASMARSDPDIEVRPWWRRVSAKWLVPVAAIATALVVWIFVGREQVPSRMQQAPSVEAARPANPPEPSAAAPALPLREPVQPQLVPPGASADNASASPARARRAEPPAGQELDKKLDRRADDDRLAAAAAPKPSAAPLPAVGGVAGGAVDALKPQGQAVADSSARSAAPPASSAPPALRAPAPVPVAAPTSPPATAASVEAKPAAPVSGVAESVNISREAAAKELAAGPVENSRAAPLEIRSPDPNYRWRISPPTVVQRSTDGGTTWSIVDPLRAATRADGGTTAVLTAGSSPSRDVCWIVGRTGTVLLSTNGATWLRRPFPETVDLTGVRALDARRATVTAVDGRQFATADGGATWGLVK